MSGIAALLVALVFSVPAFPTAIIDFSTGSVLGLNPGGSISLSGGQAIGTNIPIDLLAISGAPVNNGSNYDLSGAASSLFQDSNKAAALNFSTILNTISIVGGIPAFGIPSGTLLLSGTFSSFSLFTDGLFGSIIASGPDSKHPALLASIGLPPGTPFELFGFSVGFDIPFDGSSYIALSTHIRNTEVSPGPGPVPSPAATPEPTSLLLLGSGLLGLGGLARKKLQRKA
jgi:hypothetical protein